VSLVPGVGDGAFRAQRNIPTGVYMIGVADFNGDGNPDVVLHREKGPAILLANGDGTFHEVATNLTWCGAESNAPDCGLFPLLFSDFNGDGKADVAFPSYSFDSFSFVVALAVRLGAGDGPFGDPVFHTTIPDGPLRVVDLNGDGKP